MNGVIRLKRGEERRLKAGHLWIYADEVAHLNVDGPGALARVLDASGHVIGTAHANPDSRIVGRMLSRKPLNRLTPRWWKIRLETALSRREQLFDTPHYRLVHGDGDRLPGLVIDRFGGDVVIQAHTAGMDRALDDIIQAVHALLSPVNIYINNRAGARRLEGLDARTRHVRGKGDGVVTAHECGLPMRCHALEGQKTGYFYDQRPNRRWIGAHCADRRVLDLFAYVGAFAAQALRGGAASVTSVDASAPALDFARLNMEQNGFAERWQGIRADVMHWLQAAVADNARFDTVVCDPPAFVKSRARRQQGLRGYRKLARLAAGVTAPGGMLALASCSGLVSEDEFRKACLHGLREAGRSGIIVHVGCAGADHPWLPAMPETRYLKFLVLMLD